MSKAKQREQRNILIVVAVAVFMVIALFAWSGYNPLAQPKTGTSHTTGANIASTNTAAMTIYYSDGSHTTIGSTMSTSQALNLINQSPYAGAVGKTATSINTNLNMIPEYTGTVSSYTIAQGTFGVIIVTGTVTTLDQLGSATEIYSGSVTLSPTSPQPTMPPSGGSVIVCSSTVTSAHGDVPFSGVNYVAGQTYTLVDSISAFSISGTFTDGTTFGPVIAGNAYIFWTFQYQSSNTFTSVSVNFALRAS